MSYGTMEMSVDDGGSTVYDKNNVQIANTSYYIYPELPFQILAKLER